MEGKPLPTEDTTKLNPSCHHPPEVEEVLEACAALKCSCSSHLLLALTATAGQTIQSLQHLDRLPGYLPEVQYPRTPGRKPKSHENDGNAWAWLCDIQGASVGKLKGKTIALKDTVSVAGVPLSCGSLVLEGYVPEYDATIVTRILNEGGRILGKSACDDFCFSAMGYSSTDGGLSMPGKPDQRVGGSSGGSAILVATNKVDLAIGGDQGGSIRIPAAWCGVVGLKPTHGLVPYTGIVPFEPSLDHIGPMARNVSDCALFLEVLAGYDGLDPRQKTNFDIPQYSKLLDDLKSFKIGTVKESYEKCQPEVQHAVTQFLNRATAQGNITSLEFTVPLHAYGSMLYTAIAVQGCKTFMESGCHFHDGFHSTSLVKAVHQGVQCASMKFTPGVKEKLIIGEIMKKRYGGHYYAKARNIILDLRHEYNQILEKCDVIVMPTLTSLPQKWLPHVTFEDTNMCKEYLQSSGNMNSNTRVFNLTGHPALTIPLGPVGDTAMPGLMIIGKHFDEVKVFQVGRVLEKIVQDSVLS